MRKFRTWFLMCGLCLIAAGCTPVAKEDAAGENSETLVENSEHDNSEGADKQENADNPEITDTQNEETDKKEEANKSDVADKGAEASTDKTASEGGSDSQSLNGPYADFITGKTGIYFDYYMSNVYKDATYLSYVDEILHYIPSDRSFTVSELKDKFHEIFTSEDAFFADSDITAMEYAYIDCGKDGANELALRLVGPFVEPESELTLIIKDINNKLEVVYAYATWSRSYTAINEYGFITGDGSNGASNHGWDAAYVDASGKYWYGYYEELEYDFDAFTHFKDHDEYDLSKLDGNIMTYSLRLNEYSEDAPEADYYTFEVSTKDTYEPMDVPDLYTSSPYKAVVDGVHGCNFVSMDEFNKIKNDKLTSIGVTDEIKSGAEPVYKALTPGSTDAASASKKDNTSDGSVSGEMAAVEAKYQEYLNLDWGAMNQADMNVTTYEMFELWDKELNSLWGRIAEKVTPEKKEQLLSSQRSWIKRKEAAVKKAGEEALGGSLQPQLENDAACDYTRQRCYYLATVLAEENGEKFEISDDIRESFAGIDENAD